MFLCFNIFKKSTPLYTPTPTPNVNPIFTPSPMPTSLPSKTPTVSNIWSDLKPITSIKIRRYPFPDTKYFYDEYNKTQIILHHTVSGGNIKGDVTTFINGKYNVGVTIIIDRWGVPWQLFPSNKWAYHIGAGDHGLDKHSIAIEIDNWGGLVLGDGTVKRFNNKDIQTISGKYYAYYGNVVDVPSIQEYPYGYRGYNYFEKYTIDQIKTVGELLLYWRQTYNIPLYRNPGMFNISQDALDGKPGVWTHTSYRQDKSDIHPQPEMIEMLNTISTDEMPVSFKLKHKWLRFDRRKGHEVM